MTKKVAKRTWPLEKFLASCKRQCDRTRVRYSIAKAKAAYDAGYSVQYALSVMSHPPKPAAKLSTRKAA